MYETSIIRKIGNEYCVLSESGKRMGCYSSKKEAQERLKQIEMFRHMNSEVESAKRTKCLCNDCGSEFSSGRLCYLSYCPVCGTYGDSEELRGFF